MTEDVRRVSFSLVLFSCCALFAFTLVGCGSSAMYRTPGTGVAIGELTDAPIAERLARQPSAPYPMRLATVRLQGPGYASYRHMGYGHGNYTVVSNRDIETDDDLRRLAALDGVIAVAPLNRLVFEESLASDMEIRKAAATVQADMVLVYTFDTQFRVHDHDIGPLGLITLGTLSNQEARVTATASAGLFDVRTGFVYGLLEATAEDQQKSNIWRTSDAVDEARVRAERAVFDQLLVETEKLWGGVSVALQQDLKDTVTVGQ